MRQGWLVLAGVAALAAAGPSTAGAKPLALGGKAPLATTEMKSVDGTTTSIAKVAGKKGTLVIFTCNSCPWVKAWESRMAEIGNAWVRKDVGVIMINPNDPSQSTEDGFEEMVVRAKKLGIAFPYAVDATSDIARAFGATRTPEAYLFDANGRLVYHGAIDDNARKPGEVTERYLADALNAVAAGKDVAITETKALGCTIKFRAAKEGAAPRSAS
jgi:thiol-disulfide isomerase/thioredoxin